MTTLGTTETKTSNTTQEKNDLAEFTSESIIKRLKEAFSTENWERRGQLLVSKKYDETEKSSAELTHKIIAGHFVALLKEKFDLTFTKEEISRFIQNKKLDKDVEIEGGPQGKVKQDYFRIVIDLEGLISFIQPKPELVVETVFLLDATGSMDSQIEAAKNSVKSLQNKILQKYQGATVRFACIAYRDYTDEVPLQIQNFSSAEAVEHFLEGVKAYGGDDAPEMLESGINEVTKLNWTQSTDPKRLRLIRTVTLITDAPPHGLNWTNGMKDNYRDNFPRKQIPGGLFWETSLAKVLKLTPSFHTLTCASKFHQATVEHINKKIAQRGGGVHALLANVAELETRIEQGIAHDAKQESLGQALEELQTKYQVNVADAASLKKAVEINPEFAAAVSTALGDSSIEALSNAGPALDRYRTRYLKTSPHSYASDASDVKDDPSTVPAKKVATVDAKDDSSRRDAVSLRTLINSRPRHLPSAPAANSAPALAEPVKTTEGDVTQPPKRKSPYTTVKPRSQP